MNDMEMTEMGPFMRRHARKTRHMFVVLVAASVLVSVVAIAYGVRTYGTPGAFPGRLWFAVLFYPLPIIGMWASGVAIGRRSPMQPDGSLPMNPDDARNAMRVANVGAVYALGISLVLVASQLASVLTILQYLPSLDREGNWFGRSILVVSGALVAYFGNAWPRVPTSRNPQYKPATQRRFQRYLGWVMVLHGLVIMLAGFLLPADRVIYTTGAATIAASMVVCVVALILMLHRAMKSASAA